MSLTRQRNEGIAEHKADSATTAAYKPDYSAARATTIYRRYFDYVAGTAASVQFGQAVVASWFNSV